MFWRFLFLIVLLVVCVVCINIILKLQNIANLKIQKGLLTNNKKNLFRFADSGFYVAIMFESRYNNDAPLIIKQLSKHLSEKWSLYIYVTPNVYEIYKKLADTLNNNIKVLILEEKLTNVFDYNRIMLDFAFWKKLSNFEKILIFQLDTMVYRSTIQYFFQYDYVGAPWNHLMPPAGNNVGNGGLSLRSVKAMLYCLEHKNEVKIPKNLIESRFNNYVPEDIFFAIAMVQFGFKVPTPCIASLFSIENCYYNKSCFGSHQLREKNNKLYNQLLKKSYHEEELK